MCAQHVQALIENDMYIYPRHWATDKDGKVFAHYSLGGMLLSFSLSLSGWQGIQSPTFRFTSTQVLLTLSRLHSSMAQQLSDTSSRSTTYVTSHPDRKEPELTIPIVALGATAVSNAFDHNLTITDVTVQVFCSPV